MQYAMHRMGMLCSLRYRDLARPPYADKTLLRYSSHRRALDLVRAAGPQRVLDIGCGAGHVAQACEQMGCRVTGLDRVPPAPGTVSVFHPIDLERDPLPVDPCEFDLVLLLDVVEHLAVPEDFLVRLRNRCQGQGWPPSSPRVILSTPNVGFFTVPAGLAIGRFNYAARGILDITHKRLFTRSSLVRMLEDCAYRVERVEPIGVPFRAVSDTRLSRVFGAVSQGLARLCPGWFAFQFVVVCRPLPSVRQVLDRGAECGP
jgi:2-polyprenyl-3-methyl-5-hydroxy-6-metoxy-1,4-benzoquinol methylase